MVLALIIILWNDSPCGAVDTNSGGMTASLFHVCLASYLASRGQHLPARPRRRLPHFALNPTKLWQRRVHLIAEFLFSQVWTMRAVETMAPGRRRKPTRVSTNQTRPGRLAARLICVLCLVGTSSISCPNDERRPRRSSRPHKALCKVERPSEAGAFGGVCSRCPLACLLKAAVRGGAFITVVHLERQRGSRATEDNGFQLE